MRALPLSLLLLACAGCATGRAGVASRAAVLGRPGDAERSAVLDLDRGEPLPPSAPNPLPRPGPAELAATAPLQGLGARGEAAADVRRPRTPPPPRFGPWYLGAHGDAVMPLERAWRLRVGFGAGPLPLDAYVVEPGRRPDVYLVPGLRVERDL